MTKQNNIIHPVSEEYIFTLSKLPPRNKEGVAQICRSDRFRRHSAVGARHVGLSSSHSLFVHTKCLHSFGTHSLLEAAPNLPTLTNYLLVWSVNHFLTSADSDTRRGAELQTVRRRPTGKAFNLRVKRSANRES